MDSNRKSTMIERVKEMMTTKSFWRLCMVVIILMCMVVSVIVEMRVSKTEDMADSEAVATDTVVEDSADTMNADITEPVYIPEKETEEEVVESKPVVAVKIETEPTQTFVSKPEPEAESEPEVNENAVDEPVYIPEEPETVDETDTLTDRDMLALVIYQEAGGDAACDDCRRRVADVVLNRVADGRFPDSIYGVLTQRAQYGRLYWTGLVWPSRASNAGEAHAVERAYRIADEVLSGQHSELYGEGYIFQAEFIQGSDNIYCCGHYFGR